MKFISKASNVRIILEPGLQAQPLTGSPAKPTVFVKFTNGVAEVKEEALIAKMKAHPGYNIDFVADEEDKGVDPFAYQRNEIEPVHTITEIKYGHAEASKTSPKSNKFPPEIQKAINDLAMAKVKEILPGAVVEALKQIQSSQLVADKLVTEKNNGSEDQAPKKEETEKPKAKGRPKKAITPSTPELIDTNDGSEEEAGLFDFFKNK